MYVFHGHNEGFLHRDPMDWPVSAETSKCTEPRDSPDCSFEIFCLHWGATQESNWNRILQHAF